MTQLQDQWITPAAAAERIGWSTRYLRKQRARGLGPTPCRISCRTVRYKLADVDAWIEAHRVTSSEVK